MLKWLFVLSLGLISFGARGESASYQNTPYAAQKVVFEFYFEHPEKINTALYWVRSLMIPLTSSPYNHPPDNLGIKVIIHGTEIVSLARKNYEKYRDAVERMRYYASLGVEFKVCGMAAEEYEYQAKDFYEFVQIVPSAIAELVHWQSKGFSLITPHVYYKQFEIKDIR